MENFLRIKPITLSGVINDIIINSIFWNCQNIVRGADRAKLLCDLCYLSTETFVDENGTEYTKEVISNSLYHFEMEIPNDVLQNWTTDDVIDNFVLTYSPKFERE
jgi:hypothetical protein